MTVSKGADPLIDEQLEEVTEDWLELRHMRETGFTAGHFSLEQLDQGPVFVLGNRYRIEAFCAWLPYKNGKAAVLDILRQRRHTPHEIVRAFVAESLRLLKESGFRGSESDGRRGRSGTNRELPANLETALHGLSARSECLQNHPRARGDPKADK